MKVTLGNHYLAFVLDDDSVHAVRSAIADRIPNHAYFDMVKLHHVTIAYNIQERDIARLQALVDCNPVFETDHYIVSNCIELFSVTVNGITILTDQSESHLTISHAQDARASFSNRVLKGELPLSIYPIKIAVPLTGEFQLIAKS